MSLFTDPELPPPLPLETGSGYLPMGSDQETGDWERGGRPRRKRSFQLRTVYGYKGFVVLSALTFVYFITAFYVRYISTNNGVTLTSVFHLLAAAANKHAWLLNRKPEPATSQSAGSWGETVAAGNHLDQHSPLSNMTLHYLWCGHRFFDFRNYVAMKSAIEALRPRRVMFHYQHLPMKDPDGYFTWFERLTASSAHFVVSKLDVDDQDCYSGQFKRFALLFDILRRHGGIYIPQNAVFLGLAERFRDLSFVTGISSCNLRFFFEGIVVARLGQFQIPDTEMEQVRMLTTCPQNRPDGSFLRPCFPEERYRNGHPGRLLSCVRLDTALFPKDVWRGRDRVSSLVKLKMYGKTDLHPRVKGGRNRTPRLAHYLCEGDCTVTFTLYLSILSALHVGGLQRVMVHGAQPPSGPWWDRLRDQHHNLVLHVHKDFDASGSVPQQVTNEMRRYIMRTEILLHYGGVYHDSHVLWTQALPDELLGYEAVVSPDWHSHGMWPESVNHAVLIAGDGATYLQQLLKTLKDNMGSRSPWIVDHFFSYRLIELDPTLVYLHRYLQVKCQDHSCHPSWKPGYRSRFSLNHPGEAFDWRTETLSVHWLDASRELDPGQVTSASGLIADVAKHVLTAAGVDVDSL